MKRGLIRRDNSPSISRWDPFDEIKQTQDYLNDLFREFLPSVQWQSGETLAPLVDVQEKDDSVVVTTDLPGVDKKDVDIRVSEDMIEISATCKKEEEKEEEGYSLKERSYSSFSRAVSLPASVTEEGATAKLENGVLTVTLPKTKEAEKTKIPIE